MEFRSLVCNSTLVQTESLVVELPVVHPAFQQAHFGTPNRPYHAVLGSLGLDEALQYAAVLFPPVVEEIVEPLPVKVLNSCFLLAFLAVLLGVGRDVVGNYIAAYHLLRHSLFNPHIHQGLLVLPLDLAIHAGEVPANRLTKLVHNGIGDVN